MGVGLDFSECGGGVKSIVDSLGFNQTFQLPIPFPFHLGHFVTPLGCMLGKEPRESFEKRRAYSIFLNNGNTVTWQTTRSCCSLGKSSSGLKNPSLLIKLSNKICPCFVRE